MTSATVRAGRWWREAGLLLFLFLAAWLPRVLVLRAFVTVDEPKWLNRAGNFFVALSNADWPATFQKEHPGVTVQWLGLLGYLARFPDFVRWIGGAVTDDVLEQRLWASGLMTPLDLLVAGRWWVTLAIALAIVALFRPLRRLFGAGPALAATLFVAWSPYFLGLSRQLHPDGLLAALSLLALVLWLVWMYDGHASVDLLGAGIILGLALLTKTTAIYVGVTGALLVAIELAKGLGRGAPRWSLLTGGVVWALLAAVTFVLLWPAMWREPVAVLQRIVDQMAHYQAEVHSLPTYFRGRVVNDDPGWFFYPVVVAWRMSPLTMLGLLLAVWPTWQRRLPFDTGRARQAALGLLLFAVVVVLALGTGAKKIDRYALPALPALDILAALGWVAATSALVAVRDAQRGRVSMAAAAMAGVILLHGFFTVRHAPYYLTYFNPLLGGTRVAPRVMMIGWGEGLDQVGAWLGAQVSDEPLRVVSWYDDGPLSYTMPGDIRHQDFIDTDMYWFDADYAVLYVNQWQRENPDPGMIAHFLTQTPIFAVHANGLDLAKVYDLRGVAPPPFTGLHVESAGLLTGELYLDAYRLATGSVLPGEAVPLSLFLRTTVALGEDIQTRLTVMDPAGAVIWTETRNPAGIKTRDWTPETVYEDAYVVDVPADVVPGDYPVRVELVDADSGLTLTAPYTVTTLTVQVPAAQALDVVWDDVALTEIRYAPRVAPGRTLVVELAAAGALDGVKLSLRLVDEAGKTWAQQDQELAQAMRFELTLPDDAPLGTYDIQGVAYDGATLAARVDAMGLSPSELTTVRVE